MILRTLLAAHIITVFWNSFSSFADPVHKDWSNTQVIDYPVENTLDGTLIWRAQ